MKYLMLINHEEIEWERTPEAMAPWAEFSRLASQYGRELSAAPLEASRAAKLVCVRDGKTQVTDGPFSDTKEQLGGYYLFECDSREAALKVASMIPLVDIGHIEVRPVVDLAVAD